MNSILSNIFNRKWTISDIMSADASRQQKSAGCSVMPLDTQIELVREGILDKFKRFFTRNKAVMNVMWVIFKFSVTSDTGHNHEIIIRTQFDPNGNLYTNNFVQIYCSCPDFKFKSAWQLGQHSALFRSDRTELKLGPAITNSPRRPSVTILCKHAFAAVNYLVNNYSYLMRNV